MPTTLDPMGLLILFVVAFVFGMGFAVGQWLESPLLPSHPWRHGAGPGHPTGHPRLRGEGHGVLLFGLCERTVPCSPLSATASSGS